MELAADYAYDTNHYNLLGVKQNQQVRFQPSAIIQKTLKSFIEKDRVMMSFCRGFDKKDERTLFTEMRDKAQTMWNGERLVRRNAKDRAIFFVV